MFFPIKIGWRTMKTVIGVFITLLLFHFTNRHPAALACLSCVFAMQSDVPTSIQFGVYRVMGNSIGAVIGGIVVFLELTFGINNPYVHIFATTFGVLLVILTCNYFKLSRSIINSCATFFVVLLTISSSEVFYYTVNRVLDAFIGVTIAIIVNRLLPGLPKNEA